MRKDYGYVHSRDADFHRYDPSPCLVDAGTPLPEHTCADCGWYVAGKLEANCAKGRGVFGCTGPLRPSCQHFQPKTTTTQTPPTMKEKTTPTTKVCKECGRELPAEAFGKHARSADGLQPICRECRSKIEKGNPKYGRRKKDGTVSIPAAHAQEVKEYVETKLAKIKDAVRRPSDLDRAIVNELLEKPATVIVNPSVAEIPDHDLAKELRRRGYEVKCTKTIEL